MSLGHFRKRSRLPLLRKVGPGEVSGRRRKAPLAGPAQRWLEQLDGQVTAHTFKDYRSHVRDIVRRIGDRRLDRVTPSDVLTLRDECVRENLHDRTIRNRLRWSDVPDGAGRIEIRRAVSSIGPLDPDAPTKTGAEWSVPLKAPLEGLLRR